MPGQRVKCGLLAAMLAATACLGSRMSAPPAVDVTGTWTGDIDSNTGPPGYDPVFGTYRMTLRLTQSGSSITGEMSSDVVLEGPVSGAIAARRVLLTITVPGCGAQGSPETLELVGDVDADGRTMSVRYTGMDCSGDGTGVLTRS